jgi:hypothetical protein
MFVRHYHIRNQLYKEEYRPANCIPQQVAVLVDHAYPNMNTYETIQHKGYIETGDIIQRNAPQRSGLIHVLFYVKEEELALKLAQRWVNEEAQKKLDYRVIGIDHYFSVFE